MIGQTVSHYKITEKLGGGGMGVVYKAEDTRLGRNVALKFLTEEMQQDATARKRFLREAKSAAALDHPYICHIHEVGEVEGKSFISMEYVQGETLSQKLTEGPLPLKNALQTAVEVAEALEAAHKNDIVHRDLKPSNIMLTPEGHVKVMDFGLAKRVTPPEGQEEEITTVLTKQGSTLGTIPYMSPEQVRGQEVDTRSDIFSFGVVLYEMLAGVNPFSKGGHMETAKAVLSDTAPPLTRYTEDIPLLLQHTIKKMLAKEPDQRYQLIHEVRTNLGELIVTSGESEVSAEVPAASPTQRSSLWPVVAGGVVVLVILALALFWPSTVTAPGESIDSIAILPFDNRSGDPELEYISDGITQGIISRLSQLSSLDKVISSSSVRQYKGKEVDAGTVAREVDVRAVVMGNMASQGENLRIYVELVDAENNSTLWGETYTRPRSAVYELEETLSKEIADALGIQLSGEEGERLTRRYTENSAAHEAYLKGKFEFGKDTAESQLKAIQYFEEAIEKDPNYAPAYVTMATSYFMLGNVHRLMPPEEAMSKAEELAKKALEIDNMLGPAHSMLGFIRATYYWDWEGAEKELKLALELDPGSSATVLSYGGLMSNLGRHDEAVALGKRAIQLDPLILGFRMPAALHLRNARRYDEAIEQYQLVLDLNPNFRGANQSLSAVYNLKGLYEEAIAAYQKFLTLGGASEEEVAGLANAYQTSGKEGYWRWMLDYWTERAKQEYVPRTDFAAIYAYLGDKDQAMRWLEEAYEEHEFRMAALNVAPEWDPLRDDPRFQDLLLRMNLEP